MPTELGVHLPLIPLEEGPPTVGRLRSIARAAAGSGFSWISANDHLVFRRPWIDGPTALASVLDASGQLTLATSVLLPAVRGVAASAKTLAALDILSEGRLVAGVGPGSSDLDYVAAGRDPSERIPLFEDAVHALRVALRDGDLATAASEGAPEGIRLEPRPPGEGPPIWLAGWGGARGLRRAAELGDGWLASAYNTTPERFAESWRAVLAHRAASGLNVEGFGNGVATLWAFVTERRRRADQLLDETLGPMLGRSREELEGLTLPVGSAERCAAALSAFAGAGAQRLLLWPLADDVRQVEAFAERVLPAVSDAQ